MPAYVIAEVDVTDPEAYKLYAAKAPGITLPSGGKYLVRAGKTETLEGEPPRNRIVVIEFESMEKARAFYSWRIPGPLSRCAKPPARAACSSSKGRVESRG